MAFLDYDFSYFIDTLSYKYLTSNIFCFEKHLLF